MLQTNQCLSTNNPSQLKHSPSVKMPIEHGYNLHYVPLTFVYVLFVYFYDVYDMS